MGANQNNPKSPLADNRPRPRGHFPPFPGLRTGNFLPISRLRLALRDAIKGGPGCAGWYTNDNLRGSAGSLRARTRRIPPLMGAKHG